VQSFTNDSTEYMLSLLEDEHATRIVACTCPAWIHTKLACKHMFLVHRIHQFTLQAQPHASPSTQPNLPDISAAPSQDQQIICQMIAGDVLLRKQALLDGVEKSYGIAGELLRKLGGFCLELASREYLAAAYELLRSFNFKLKEILAID